MLSKKQKGGNKELHRMAFFQACINVFYCKYLFQNCKKSVESFSLPFVYAVYTTVVGCPCVIEGTQPMMANPQI